MAKQLKPFTIKPGERAGIKRAAQYHQRLSRIFHGAVVDRHKYNIPYGEMLMKAEYHEGMEQEFLSLLKQNS